MTGGVRRDNVRVGEMQARYLVERLGGKGRIVRIYGAPTDNNARLFKEGQDRVLEPLVARGEIEVIEVTLPAASVTRP